MFSIRKSQVCTLMTCMVMLAVAPLAVAQTFPKAKTRFKVPAQSKIKKTVPANQATEDVSLFRVQLRVKTANRKNAGTDDSVLVRLSNGQGTWVDTAANDHERGRTYVYDLMLPNSGMKVQNISKLEISKTGSDGWCIESLELLVNNGVIFQKTFSGGHWLDNSKGRQRKLVISSKTLRSNSKWRRFQNPRPSPVIKRAELEQRIESIIGHHMHSQKRIKWGKLSGRGVEVTYKDAQTIHVDLDLKAVINNFPDAGVDVDFDIRITSRRGAIDLKILNLKPRVTTSLHKALLAVNSFFGGTSRKELERSITNGIKRNLAGAISVSTGSFDVVVIVNSRGDVILLPKS